MIGDMIYKWKPGSQFKVKPEVAGAELERLRVKFNGRLVQANIVDAAKSRDNPLHNEFEWDNSKAAHQYRLSQAGDLIRALVVVVEQENEAKSPPLRAYVNVTQESGRSYTSLAHALSDDELRAQLVEQAWKELSAWKQRYGELTEFAKLITVIDAMNGGFRKAAA